MSRAGQEAGRVFEARGLRSEPRGSHNSQVGIMFWWWCYMFWSWRNWMEKCSKDSILIKSGRMTRIVVVSWSTYPDLKSCQRNLVNWVASMRKGVVGEFNKRLRAGLFQNELQTSYSWNILKHHFNWSYFFLAALFIFLPSPFHHFSQPAVAWNPLFDHTEVPSTFAAACARASQKTVGDCWLTWLVKFCGS